MSRTSLYLDTWIWEVQYCPQVFMPERGISLCFWLGVNTEGRNLKSKARIKWFFSGIPYILVTNILGISWSCIWIIMNNPLQNYSHLHESLEPVTVALCRPHLSHGIMPSVKEARKVQLVFSPSSQCRFTLLWKFKPDILHIIWGKA